ncbi:hypothetical protein PV04_03895 [Phialophora macrospora]|uniref:Uncharacterized protein n=1 Tax=Phialophora macrospora TaxID=1851006 RepID=A0A0D2D2N7_9EURO|nr:hypothetical protein PV04_03895 [Phialophora macrospora]
MIASERRKTLKPGLQDQVRLGVAQFSNDEDNGIHDQLDPFVLVPNSIEGDTTEVNQATRTMLKSNIDKAPLVKESLADALARRSEQHRKLNTMLDKATDLQRHGEEIGKSVDRFRNKGTSQIQQAAIDMIKKVLTMHPEYALSLEGVATGAIAKIQETLREHADTELNIRMGCVDLAADLWKLKSQVEGAGELQSRCTTLEAEKGHLERQMEKVGDLQKENSQLRREIAKLRKDAERVTGLEAEIKTLREENNSQAKQLNEEVANWKRLAKAHSDENQRNSAFARDKAAQSEREIARLTRLTEMWQGYCEGDDEALANYRADIERLKSREDRLKDQIVKVRDELSRKLEASEKEKRSNGQQLNELRLYLAGLARKNSSLQRKTEEKLQESEDEVRCLKDQLEQLQARVRELTDDRELLDAEHAMMDSVVEMLQSDVSSLTADARSCEHEATKMKHQMESQALDQLRHDDENAMMSDIIEQLQGEVAQLRTHAEYWKQETANVKTHEVEQVIQLEQQISELRDQATHAADNARRQIEMLQDQKDELCTELSNANMAHVAETDTIVAKVDLYQSTMLSLLSGLFPPGFNGGSFDELVVEGTRLLRGTYPHYPPSESIPYIEGIAWPLRSCDNLMTQLFVLVAKIVGAGVSTGNIDAQILVVGLRECDSETLSTIIPWLYAAIAHGTQLPDKSLPEIVVMLQCLWLLFICLRESDQLAELYVKLKPAVTEAGLLVECLSGCVDGAQAGSQRRLTDSLMSLGTARGMALEMAELTCFMDGASMIVLHPDGRVGIAMPGQFGSQFDAFGNEFSIQFTQAPIVGSWATQPIPLNDASIDFASKLRASEQ